jgi:murein DD-endopeptidase MepM/ murein hydrolase activator NlpD
MKALLFIVFIFTSLVALSQQVSRARARKLQRGAIKEDTSFVYQLPFAPGKAYRMVQGYFGSFTHKRRMALDFKMKDGTPVHAVRGGVVVRVRDTGSKGGLKASYRPHGNFIAILHTDSTRAIYWHLQKDGALVNVGDTVKTGQLIGLSGHTGYSAFPHLHFMVWRFDEYGNWQQIPTRFATTKGVRYLRPWRKYRRPRE